MFTMKRLLGASVLMGVVFSGPAAFGSVNIASGNLSHAQTLFHLPNSKLLGDFILSYNSLDGEKRVLGTGWTHTLHIRLKLNSDGSYTLVKGDGKRIVFSPNGSRYTPDGANYPALTFRADGTSTLEWKEGIFYTFDPGGNLTSLSDRNSNAITFSYDSSQNLIRAADPSGRSIAFDYEPDGRLKDITEPNGNVHSFTYAEGNLTGVSSQLAKIGLRAWAYEYYPNGFLWTKTDPLGNKTEYFYDDQHRVVRSIDPEGRTREVIYDPANSQTQLVEKDGGVWIYRFDPSLGVLTEKTDPLHSTWAYEYDGERNLKSVQDPKGNKTSYTYDGNGNMTSAEDALGHVTRYTYNSFNKVAAVEPAPGEPLVSFGYDPRGNLTRVADQLGIERGYEYDSRGNLIAVKHPLEQIGLDYNSQSYLVGVKNLLSGLSLFEFGYDAAGNRTSQKEVQGTGERIIRYEYNGLNRTTMVTGPPPELNATSFEYDVNGNLRRIIDGNGKPTGYEYNYQGQVTKMTDALGYETIMRYGAGCPSCGAGVDKLTAVTDAKNQATIFEYDQAGNLLKETSPMGYVTSYTYDAARNPHSRMDANGNTTFYVFDELNRLREIKYPDGDSVTFAYDNRGNLKSAANLHTNLEFAYDYNNRLTEVLDSGARAIRYEYDALGNRTRMTTPDGRIVDYRYDPSNHLSRILVNGVPGFDFVHDPYGRRMQLKYPNKITTTYSYNPSSYLTEISTRNSRKSILNSFTYTHDAVGNRKSMEDISGVHRYEYDNIYQLIRAVHPGMPQERFHFDPVGNWTSKKAVDADNRLLEDAGHTYRYDANGNLVEKTRKRDGRTTAYSYDWENRLVKIESPGKVVGYKYDALGRRIEKDVNGTVTGFFYDGWNVVLEYNARGGVKSRYLHGPGVDEPLLLERGKNAYYYHADGLGSIISLTNESGKVVQNYEYGSFGKILHQAGTLPNPFTFTGREYDEESGLYYYRARYYDPKAGRFLTKDPIGFGGGDINVYRYATNNPVNYRDPWGLWNEDVHSGIGRTDYGTYIWARQTGLTDIQAKLAAWGNSNTDNISSWIFIPGRHFNAMGRIDSRDVFAYYELMSAVALHRQGNHCGAFYSLGRGLHSLQDKIAHGGVSSYRVHDPILDDAIARPVALQETEFVTKQYLEEFLRRISK